MSIEVDVESNARQVQKDLKRWKEKTNQKFDDGLDKVVMEIFEESQNLVPVDTGNLRRSGDVIRQGNKKYKIVYEAEYAVYVHEINKDYNNGTWKFLEKAQRRILNDVPQIIASKMREIL